MTQDELWLTKWQEAIDFLETNHRKPSKFVPEERNMRSWWKHNKKLMNAGELKPERLEMFRQLLEIGEKYKHVNQYQRSAPRPQTPTTRLRGAPGGLP